MELAALKTRYRSLVQRGRREGSEGWEPPTLHVRVHQITGSALRKLVTLMNLEASVRAEREEVRFYETWILNCSYCCNFFPCSVLCVVISQEIKEITSGRVQKTISMSASPEVKPQLSPGSNSRQLRQVNSSTASASSDNNSATAARPPVFFGLGAKARRSLSAAEKVSALEELLAKLKYHHQAHTKQQVCRSLKPTRA